VLKCLCFCYLGLELAFMRGPLALLGQVTTDAHAAIRAGAQFLVWTTAAFCVVRGLPVFLEGSRYFAERLPGQGRKNHPQGDAA
jgi:hypothetical protein